MARSFVTLTFVTLTATSLGVFAAVGCGSTGKVSLGADDDHLTACDPASCGPALGAPTTKCADGSLGGNTGRCVKTSSSSCGWEIRTCTDPTATDCKPPPPVVCADGTVTVAGCSKDSSGVCACAGTTCPGGGSCTPAACGANPFGAPNYKCADGSTGGPVCDASPGKCGWYIRSCPSSRSARIA